MNQIYYNLFMRNWMNGAANEPEIDRAVELGYIIFEQGKTIKSTPRLVNAA